MQHIVYLGFNSFTEHKRGVENVIILQASACLENRSLYIYFGGKRKIYRWKNIICISIKHDIFRFVVLNFVIHKLSKRYSKLLIHSHNPLMTLFLIKRTNIFTIHDGLYYLSKNIKHKLTFLFKFLEPIVYRKSDVVHFVSNYTFKHALLKNHKYSINIPNSTPLEDLKSKLVSSKVISKGQDDRIKILSVRSIEDRAGIDLIIEVAEKLRNQKFEFQIIGKGPLLNTYKALIIEKGLDNIHFLGYIPDDELIKYYFQADLVLITALYGEGFGLPIIEGYLFNKPVIASNVCAIPEVIIINKKFLFENKSNDLITKLKEALTDNQHNYIEFYTRNYSNQEIRKRYFDLYTKIFKNL